MVGTDKTTEKEENTPIKAESEVLRCHECGDEIIKDTQVEQDGEYYCRNCFDNLFFKCDDCDNYFLKRNSYDVDGGCRVCECCFNENYVRCCHCDKYINNEENERWKGENYCSDCLSEVTNICDNCGDRIDRDDTYFDNDNCYCESCHEEEEQPEEIKLQFKKIKSKTFKKNIFKNYCGIELETINDNLKEYAFESLMELEKLGFSQVFDGSLGNKGLEFISLAFNGDELLNRVKNFTEELKNRSFFINSDCGYHLHIGIKQDLEELKKIFYFYLKYEHFFFKMASESRQNNHYCKKLNDLFKGDYMNKLKEIKTLLDFQKMLYETEHKRRINSYKKEKYYEKRYFWVNFHSVFYRRTLEIRLHNGTIDERKINNWILIHLKVLDLLKKMNLETINLFPNSEEFFLSLFDKNIQDYIKERWAKFENKTITKDEGGED